jgi:hypothetical protein
MELTGKCKVDFKKWFNANKISDLIIGNVSHYYGEEDVYFYDVFDYLPPSAKYGVYVDFFDSVGVEIYYKAFKMYTMKKKEFYFIIIDCNCMHLNNYLEDRKYTRPEARTAAIEKANEIYNSIT